MSSKVKIVFVGSLLILLVIFSIICLFIPKIEIELLGDKTQKISIGEKYKELGGIAYVKRGFKKETLKYEIIGKVDTDKIGKYIITYKTKFNNIFKEAIRVIEVVDNIKPTIALNDNAKLCKKNNLLELNVTAVDNYDGDISKSVKYKLTGDKLLLSVTDSSNNRTEIVKKIKYIDSEKPLITLNGSNIIYINENETYEEFGATAYDSCDGNISEKIKISNNVNINVAGTYKVDYIVKDSSGYETKVQRTVIVKNEDLVEYPVIKGATIYLTFDDGPSKYTDEILNVLDRYDVKATFFVTNQFPEYQNIIKKEYEKGHTIGIHTYSHKWSIYENEETYLADFNLISEIVYTQTGKYTKLFRFPGGSSNTISRRYNKGIMSKLSKIMENNGYIYFDWTFDSGDTNKKDSSSKAILKNIKMNLKGDGEYIILMHDIKKSTLEALPNIIEFAQARGYKFSALTENSPTEHFKIAN